MMKWLCLLALVFTIPACAAETKTITIKRTDGQVVTFKVERATDDASREYGLMNRTALPADHGMLFVYGSPGLRAFWMKDTLIPLDMLFFRENGELVYIHPNAQPQDLANIQPMPARHDICAILEINGGMAAKAGLKPGDHLILDGPTACLN